MKLPKNVEFILERLESSGHRADIVGGPVRDFLLGKSPDDYDITTSASPEETKRVFSDLRTVDTGIKHGTVSLILDGVQYEVTTYRIDGEYKDSRHPECVTFTKEIEEDLRRRDFTMNAIAYSPRHGITDPYGGREDTANGVIRAVGEPYLRFTEDALRILRGVRFSATLGFTVEAETKKAMLDTRRLLGNVSVERIYVELKKMISGAYSYPVFTEFSDIISDTLPELSGLELPDRELYGSADYTSRLIALFYLNSASPAAAFEAAMKRLHTDSHIRELGLKVLPLIESADTASDVGLTRILRIAGEESAKELIKVRILLGLSHSDDLTRFGELLSCRVAYRISDLKIDGKRLIALGAKGKQIGEILDRLLDGVIDGVVENTEEALTVRARSLM